MLRIIFCGLAIFLATSQAGAGSAPDISRTDQTAIKRVYGEKVAQKIFSDFLTKLRADALKKSGANIPGYDCKGDRLSAMIEALPFPIQKNVVSWVERYIVDCEPRAQRNLMIIVENNHVRAIELLPGETKADPRLQRDAIVAAKAAALAENPKSCEQAWTTDTRAIKPYKDGHTPWVERWSFDLCGRKAVVEMSFLPGGASGTSYAAKLVK